MLDIRNGLMRELATSDVLDEGYEPIAATRATSAHTETAPPGLAEMPQGHGICTWELCE
jgi:hypothetical protein